MSVSLCTVGSGSSGGGAIPYTQEFTSSGTFTPTSGLISAGGRIGYIVVGGGASGASTYGGGGGHVWWGYTTLTSTTGCAITIGAGGASNTNNGGSTTAAFASAGGTTIVADGGQGSVAYGSVNWGGYRSSTNYAIAGNSGNFGFGRGGGGAFGGLYDSSGTYGGYGMYYGSGVNRYGVGVHGFVRIYWYE